MKHYTPIFKLPDNTNIGKLFSKYELFSLNQANLISYSSQILTLPYPFPLASLSPSPSLSNFRLVNWNSFSTQYSSCFSLVSLFFSYTSRPNVTIIGYAKPYTNPSQSKIWAFKSCFSFKIRQHGQNQLFLRYKVSRILCKMVDVLSFSQLLFWMQPPLQFPPKIRSPTSAIFYLPIPSLLVHKIILTIPTNTPFIYTSAIFYIFIFVYIHLCNLHQMYFVKLRHLVNSDCVKGLESKGVVWELILF